MNKSERIRSLISSPKTAAEIQQSVGVPIATIRGILQRMVIVGKVDRIGCKKPYKYQNSKGYTLDKKNVAQLIRDQLKIKQMAPAQVAALIGVTTERAYLCMRDMVKTGILAKGGDGTYIFVREPKKPMSKEEAREKKNAARRVGNNGQRRYPVKPYTVIAPKKIKEEYTGPKQSVEDWIKAGGKIDRNPTIPKFERLTAEDIAATPFRPSSMQGGTSRAYLAG